MILRVLITLTIAAMIGEAGLVHAQPAPTAETQAASTGERDFQAERERIATQRRAIENRALQDDAACYQRFSVNDCLREQRRQRREQIDALKQHEAAINDVERKSRGVDQLRRIEEKQTQPRSQDHPAQQAQSREAQQNRAERAAEHAQGRAATAAEVQDRRRAFQNKQRDHAQNQAQTANRRAQAPEERERFQRKQAAAERHRTERAQRNAQKTKPPAAPLPPP